LQAFLDALPERPQAQPQAAEIAALKAELGQTRLEYSKMKRLLDTSNLAIEHIRLEKNQWFEKAKKENELYLKEYEKANKLESELAESQRKLTYAEEHLGILAKTFGYEGRTWCNMVSYLCPRLQRAEKERDKAQAELAAMRESLESKDRVHKQDTEHLESRLYKAEAELASLRELALRQPIIADDGRSLGQVLHEILDEGLSWDRLLKGDKEQCKLAANAVVAAARPQIAAECLAQAVRRMEAVPVKDLADAAMNPTPPYGLHGKAEAIRSRLIAAVKDEGQAQEVLSIIQGVDGTIYHDPEKAYAQAEEAECVKMWLDSVEAPTQDAEGNGYSLVGRIQAWGAAARGEAALSAIDDEGNPATTSDEPSDPYHAEEVPEPAWIPHDGGSCPLKDEEVEEWEYKLLDGSIYNYSPPSERGWKHLGCFADIIAYRVLKWKPGFGPEAKAEPDTFEAHGKAWTRHKPGDPCLCDPSALVYVAFKDGTFSSGPDFAEVWGWGTVLTENEWIIGWRYADEPAQAQQAEDPLTGTQPVNLDEAWMQARPWTSAVGDTVRSIPEMALGGQMYWRDLAIQIARVWWKCHNIGASLQHGDLDKDIAFSIVCERHGGRVFHGDTPENAWHKAEMWLLSPDREDFPAACLAPAKP